MINKSKLKLLPPKARFQYVSAQKGEDQVYILDICIYTLYTYAYRYRYIDVSIDTPKYIDTYICIYQASTIKLKHWSGTCATCWIVHPSINSLYIV